LIGLRLPRGQELSRYVEDFRLIARRDKLSIDPFCCSDALQDNLFTRRGSQDVVHWIDGHRLLIARPRYAAELRDHVIVAVGRCNLIAAAG